MSEPTREQLVAALRRADAAGDAEAARAIARRIQAMEQAPQGGEDNRDRGNIPQQIASGLANTATNLGAGLVDAGAGVTDRLLGAVDFATGDWQFPERMREQSRAMREGVRMSNEARNEQFDQNATGVERGSALVGEIASYALPATKIDKAVRGAGMLSRGAAQAAGAMGLDSVFQGGEGAEEIDAGRSAVTGAAAFGAEMVAPVFARIGRAGIRAIKGQADSPIDVGREIARRAGIEDVPDDLAQKLANAADEIEAGARPEAVLAREEFGFPLTRGQLTGRFDDLSAEDLLRPTNQGRKIRSIDEAQSARQGELVDELTGGLDSPQTVVDNARRSVRGALGTAEQSERAAWRQVEGSNLRLSPRVADDFANRTRDALKNFPDDPSIVGDAADALNKVEGLLRQSDSIDMRQLQDARSMLAARAANAPDRRQATMLNRAKKAFDDALANVDEGALLSGEIDDIGRLRAAVSETAGKYRTFSARGKGDDAGRAVESLLQTENVDKLTSRLLGSGQVTGLSTGDFARALTRTLGRDAPELQQLRQAVLLKAATRSGDSVGPQQLSRNIKKLLKERRDVLGQLFTKQEISQLGRMTNALDVLWQKPGTIGRSSGTTERAIRFMESISGGGIPGLSQIGQLGAWLGRRNAAGRALSPLRTTPTAPAIPAAAAAGASNRPNGQ